MCTGLYVDTAPPVQGFKRLLSSELNDKIVEFMPLILVTNDDGVTSEGIHALADAMKPLGDVLVVAPLQEASAIGHALTLRRPLRIETISDGVYGVDGTPTDCVNLACAILLKGQLPDLVVSGSTKAGTLATTSPIPARFPARSKVRCLGLRASPSR